MARRASATLLGLFIVGAVILAISATLIFSGGWLREKTLYVMYFIGSVNGLSVGAPVHFRGVKIGTVTDIRLLLDPNNQKVKIPVYVELDPTRFSLLSGEELSTIKMLSMIKNGLRAQLQMQSLLTGQLAIQLDIYPDKPATLIGATGKIIEIPTAPSPIQELTRLLEEFPVDKLLQDLTSAIQGVDTFFSSAALPQTIKQFDQTLRDYSALANDYQNLGQQLEQRSEHIATDLKSALGEVRSTLQATQALISSGKTVMNNSNDLVNQLRNNADQITASTTETLTALKASSDSVNQLIAADSPLEHQLSKTLAEVASSARALRALANTLEQNPEALLKGKPYEGVK
ncbi:MAG: paraquat-inducible protein B [Halothiobacillaceae bacterium]|nr:MAG: paraquat-inducible protein B [Halothiobacillaceae bacterium]